jgi:hypothetical protein
MLDLMQALHAAPSDAAANAELSGLMLSDEELGQLGLEQLESDAVLSIMLPGTQSEDEQQTQERDEDLESLWSAALGDADAADVDVQSPLGQEDDYLVRGERSESPDEVMTMMMMEHAPEATMHADALFPSSAVAPLPPLGLRDALVPPPPEKKRRGRKPSPKSKESKPKRPPPSEAKARLRSYERRSRHKREVSRVALDACRDPLSHRYC